jgi:AcrR family transcriptional regulator
MQTKTDDRLFEALQARSERVPPSEHTRRKILARAVEIASIEGLEGLTIGRLAADLAVSKSGVFAHFGSKEELQLQTIEFAIDRFFGEVIVAAVPVERGLPRLKQMLEAWVSYVERGIFPGGCFFAAASLEFDGRPGPVREKLAKALQWWFNAIQEEIEKAISLAQLPSDADPGQFAFELHAVVQEANWGYQMFRNPVWFERARASISAALARAAAEKELALA